MMILNIDDVYQSDRADLTSQKRSLMKHLQMVKERLIQDPFVGYALREVSDQMFVDDPQESYADAGSAHVRFPLEGSDFDKENTSPTEDD